MILGESVQHLRVSLSVLALSLWLHGPGTLPFLRVPEASTERQPVPSDPELKEARERVKVLLRSEYSQAAGRAAHRPALRKLARKLFETALKTRSDLAGKFVLLEDACWTAGQAGDLPLAFQAAEALSECFQVDVLTTKSEILVKAAATTRAPDECRSLAMTTLDVIDQCLSGREYEAAYRLASYATKVSRASRDSLLIPHVRRRGKHLQTIRDAYERVEYAFALLKHEPDNSRAHQTAGEFLCLVVRDWNRGLEHLTRGKDPGLQDLARRDLDGPEDPLKRMEMGDRWWDFAGTQAGERRLSALLRSRYWYVQALSGPHGLRLLEEQSRIETRMNDVPGCALLRVSGRIDGLDEIQISTGRVEWVHKAWQPPGDLRINGKPWDVTKTQILYKVGAADVDLLPMEIIKQEGRGTIRVERRPGKNVIVIHDGLPGSGGYAFMIDIGAWQLRSK